MFDEHTIDMHPLATLASNIDISDEAVDVRVIKKTLRATIVELIPIDPAAEKDWRLSIIQNLIQPSSSVATKN